MHRARLDETMAPNSLARCMASVAPGIHVCLCVCVCERERERERERVRERERERESMCIRVCRINASRPAPWAIAKEHPRRFLLQLFYMCVCVHVWVCVCVCVCECVCSVCVWL